jgi:hypothetical protein
MFGARAPRSPDLKLQKIELKHFKKFLKRYHGVDNIVFYECVFFLELDMLYIGLSKNDKLRFCRAVMNSAWKTWFCVIVQFYHFY